MPSVLEYAAAVSGVDVTLPQCMLSWCCCMVDVFLHEQENGTQSAIRGFFGRDVE